jgi:hypothetical protein
MRRRPMQVSIERILEAHGELDRFNAAVRESAGGEFSWRFTKPSYLDLTIEIVGPNRVAVAHTFTQNGDLMRDPEIVFYVDNDLPPSMNWIPVELTQDPMGVYRSKFTRRNGREYVDVAFHQEVDELARVWAKNLRHQGWERATIAS